MDTLICAGGTGVRILEAVLHLCAAGLGPPRLRIFILDPDATNGNMEITRKLVNQYIGLHRIFGKRSDFFRTELDLLRDSGDEAGVQVWSPVKANQQFKDVVNFDALTPAQREVVHLLFTDSELEMKMDIGYQGHPALGAAALSLLPLFHHDDRLLKKFADALANDLAAGESTVVVAGSIFGGTGASSIHPMVRYLRSEDLLKTNRDKLKVAAIAVVPYFQFSSAKDTVTDETIKRRAAKSEDFPLASRAAAEYYSHLRETGDWDFDAMYWVGDSTPAEVRYAPGGSGQTNPAHFVDLLGAFGCLDFFSNRPDGKACWYCGPHNVDAPHNELHWADLPIRGTLFKLDRAGIRHRLLLFQTMVLAHLGMNRDILQLDGLAGKPYLVPWYADRFLPGELSTGDGAGELKLLEAYWSGGYLPWWSQVHDLRGRVALLNRAAWEDNGTVDLAKLENLSQPVNTNNSLEAADHFFAQMVAAADTVEPDDTSLKNPAELYVALLGRASEQLLGSAEAA